MIRQVFHSTAAVSILYHRRRHHFVSPLPSSFCIAAAVIIIDINGQ
jgi:hypothetical protein